MLTNKARIGIDLLVNKVSSRTGLKSTNDIIRAVNGAVSRALEYYGSRDTCSCGATRPVDLSNSRTAGCAIQPLSLFLPSQARLGSTFYRMFSALFTESPRRKARALQ